MSSEDMSLANLTLAISLFLYIDVTNIFNEMYKEPISSCQQVLDPILEPILGGAVYCA